MQQFIDSYIATLSGQFFINQVITILLLVIYGVVFVGIIRGKSLSIADYILAYPLSLLAYSISGYFLLSAGIKFNKYSVIITMALFLIITAVFFRKRINIKSLINKNTLIYIALAVILTLVSVSGIVPVSATNDSMYFFSEYPRALVHYEKIGSILDNFLTDASQGIAVLSTLPFFYGFDEIFGVQTLLNINFLAFFAYAVQSYASTRLDKKNTYVITFVSIVMLVTSMPFVLMSRWFMANAFFMEYMAVILYFAYEFSLKEETDRADLLVLAVLITGLSIMRMEGALNAGVLILSIMMLKFKSKDIALYFLSPVLILQSLYLYRIFIKITLHTKIQFMTKEKAVVLIAFLIIIMLYALLIRNRLSEKLEKNYGYLLVLSLISVNLVILVYDRSGYIINLKAFIFNMLKNSGWGLFVPFVIGVFILIPKKSIKINYFDISVVCYILITIIAGWARGDNLYESFGDSGNRIMIQAVPVILFALIVKVTEGLKYWKEENLG